MWEGVTHMADTESTGSTGIVAIFAILMMILISAFLAWRTGIFGGADHKALDIHVNAPSSSSR